MERRPCRRKKKKKENLYIRLGPTEKMAHAEEKEGLLSRSICCIVVRPPPPSLAAPPEGTITTTGPDDHQVLSTFRVFPHRRRRRLRKNLLPPSHVPRHYSPEISTICVSALRPISLRDPHRFAGEGEEESHLLREANCDLDDFLRPGGGWMGWKQLMLFEEERWEDRFTWNRSNSIAYYYFPSCLLCTLFLSVLSICFRFYKR